MRLQQNQFIRQILLEDARLMVGSRVYFDGTTWEAVEQKTDGWLWRVVSGRNPNWNPEVDTKFFRFPGSVFANSIYNQPNVDNSYVTNGKQEVKDTRKPVIVSLPPGVVDEESAFNYSIKNPGNVDVENVFSNNPKLSYDYARTVNKEFIAGENAIKTVPELASRYAINVLNRRWPEAEEIIRTNPLAWDSYKIKFRIP